MKFLSALTTAILAPLASARVAYPLPRAAAALERVQDFGENPSNAKMFIYVPAKLAEKPPIIVAIHYCTGTAQAYYSGSPYAQLADQKGFIVIYPESPYSGTCWDVSSFKTLSHEGGGNSNGIANMVRYTIDKYGADPEKVFVTGTSSGAMMTNVMAATYPEMFQAGIAYSGVPAGCFMSSSGGEAAWNNSCAQGQARGTPEVWAKMVHDMYPEYEGEYPRMQIYHGSADSTLAAPNYNETIKQWCGVMGYNADAPEETLASVPQGGYTTYVFGERLQGIYAQGVGHSVPIHGAEDMAFFGLD